MIEYTVKVRNDGTKFWYLHDKLHREDGPAIEGVNGHKAWYINDKLHREDGPAIEWASGSKSWYLNGEKLTEAEFIKRTSPVKEMTVKELEEHFNCKIKIVK